MTRGGLEGWGKNITNFSWHNLWMSLTQSISAVYAERTGFVLYACTYYEGLGLGHSRWGRVRSGIHRPRHESINGVKKKWLLFCHFSLALSLSLSLPFSLSLLLTPRHFSAFLYLFFAGQRKGTRERRTNGLKKLRWGFLIFEDLNFARTSCKWEKSNPRLLYIWACVHQGLWLTVDLSLLTMNE